MGHHPHRDQCNDLHLSREHDLRLLHAHTLKKGLANMKKYIRFICCTVITAIALSACDTTSQTGIEYIPEVSSEVADINGETIFVTETLPEEVTDNSETIVSSNEDNKSPDKETDPTNENFDKSKPTNTPTPRPANVSSPNATPTPKPTDAPESASSPVLQVTNTPTPSPKTTETPVPTTTVTPKPTATPSPKPTATSTPKPTSTPTPTATPTPEPHEHDWIRYPHIQSWDGNLGYLYYCECGEYYYENCYAESDPDREAVAAIVRVPTTVYGCNITTGYGTAWEDGEDVSVLVVREYVVQPKDGAYYHDPCIYDYEWYELYEDPEDLYAGFYEVYPVSVAYGYGTAYIDGNLIGPELIGFVDEPLNYIPWY